MKILKYIISFFLVAGLAGFLMTAAGCSHFNSSGPRANLRESVHTLWTAKASQQWGNVYDQLSSATRKKYSRERFTSRANVIITDFSINHITPSDNGQKAIVKIDYTASQNNYQIPMVANEEWVLEDRQWRLNLVRQFPVGK